MVTEKSIPLLRHNLKAPTAFSPESLIKAVRTDKQLETNPIPTICVLEFDGDLTDWLVLTRKAKLCKSWACFHTKMYTFEIDGLTCGIVSRTIGGPYAVLIAEQMKASGARLVLGLTSAGRVSPSIPIPSLVVATKAIRDEGTSYHYLPPSETVNAPIEIANLLETELKTQQLPVQLGIVWTTDAPYRETKKQLSKHAEAGILAVEMQAASLFAFAAAHDFPVGLVAYVTNGIDQTSQPFNKDSTNSEFEILQQMCRAGKRFISSIESNKK